jgi:hypothetical protein
MTLYSYTIILLGLVNTATLLFAIGLYRKTRSLQAELTKVSSDFWK